MKRILAIVLSFSIVACGGGDLGIVTPTSPVVAKSIDAARAQLTKDYPVMGDYDPTERGTIVPSTITEPETKVVINVPTEHVVQTKQDAKDEVDAKINAMSNQIKIDARAGFFTKDELVRNYSDEFIGWLAEREADAKGSAGEWIWTRAKEAFDYGGQIEHLRVAIPIVFGHVLCDGSDKDSYSMAMSYVSAVAVEIIAGVGCAIGGFSAPLVTLVCMPLGYIGGAALGEFILGPVIYDYRCKK